MLHPTYPYYRGIFYVRFEKLDTRHIEYNGIAMVKSKPGGARTTVTNDTNKHPTYTHAMLSIANARRLSEDGQPNAATSLLCSGLRELDAVLSKGM